MATGLFLGRFSDDTPLERISYAQVSGGLEGLKEHLVPTRGIYTVVCEKFSPRPMARTYRLAELEPLRIEGWLTSRFSDITWQSPGYMVLEKGKTTAENKKLSDNLLKRGGLWLTGKNVGLKDANDANAAAKHALAHMRSIKHQPSIDKYFNMEEAV